MGGKNPQPSPHNCQGYTEPSITSLCLALLACQWLGKVSFCPVCLFCISCFIFPVSGGSLLWLPGFQEQYNYWTFPYRLFSRSEDDSVTPRSYWLRAVGPRPIQTWGLEPPCWYQTHRSEGRGQTEKVLKHLQHGETSVCKSLLSLPHRSSSHWRHLISLNTALFVLVAQRVQLWKCLEWPSTASPEHLGHHNLANILPIWDQKSYWVSVQKFSQNTSSEVLEAPGPDSTENIVVAITFFWHLKTRMYFYGLFFCTSWSCVALKGKRGRYPSLKKSALQWRAHLPERGKEAVISLSFSHCLYILSVIL